MEVQTVRTVSSFLSLVEQTKRDERNKGNKEDFLFRGQSSDKPLKPRIARLTPKGKDLIKLERLMFNDFERQSLPFRDSGISDPWDLLALGQHHGLPTRLLDWTYSALAALWFCVEERPREWGGSAPYGVVWLLKTRVSDFMAFPTKEELFMNTATLILRPRVVSARIHAQSGVFICHTWSGGCHTRPDGCHTWSDGRFTPLDQDERYSSRLARMDIPWTEFGDIRDQLNACGVNRLTLFPDLDGLSGHLEYRYFHEDAGR